jgi:nitrilase
MQSSWAARRHRVVLSVGVTEKGGEHGGMWNTNLLFDADGQLLNRPRKLVPTWAEKLTWANGRLQLDRVLSRSAADG